MGTRRRKRVKMVLPVRITGKDAEGNSFVEMAHTLDLTQTGARIGGMRHRVSSGEIVEIQCRHLRARFRVVWAGNASAGGEEQVGVEAIEAEKDIWKLGLASEATDEYQQLPPAAPRRYEKREDERRKASRIPVVGMAHITRPYGGEGMSARVEDISAEGCYVKTDRPYVEGTTIKLLIKVQETEIDTLGVVRACYAGIGMGVEFIAASHADALRLRSLIQKLEIAAAAGQH